MSIEILQERVELLVDYEKVPITFWVRSRLLINFDVSGVTLNEKVAEEPYLKDYDAYERPSKWPSRFDMSNWGIFAAFDDGNRIGGAVAAWKTPGLELLEERDDLVCLWDLRVHPSYRHRGVGHRLFRSVIDWSHERQCDELVIETQDINVPACRFYARQGCELRSAKRDAYPAELNEIQLMWYRKLGV